MITENLSILKIHKLSQEQYDREFEAGNVDESALYLTPEEEIDLSGYATKDELDGKADSDHIHITDSGGSAMGIDSSAGTGGAVGQYSQATSGFSGGYNAIATVDAIQLGAGTNETAKSLQVYDKQLLNGNGMIPFARYAKFVQGTTAQRLEANVVANDHTVYSENGAPTVNPGSVIVVPVMRSSFDITATVRYYNGNTMIQVTRPLGMSIDSTITEYYVDYWIFSENPIE